MPLYVFSNAVSKHLFRFSAPSLLPVLFIFFISSNLALVPTLAVDYDRISRLRKVCYAHKSI